jgi:predicted nucleic acid-binding Zn ribbon protein
MSETVKKGWIPPHNHCRVCGKSIPVNKEFCSKKCEEEAEKITQRNKRSSRIYIIIFIVLMAMLLLWSFTTNG